MFDAIIKKNNLKKQKLCLEYIKDLLNDESIFIYNTSKGLVKYHEEFFRKGIIKGNILSNPLYAIKHFYQKDLHQREHDLKFDGNDSTILKMKEADQMFLNELDDEFISKYEDIITKLHQIERLKVFLTDEQRDTFMTQIEEKYHIIKTNTSKQK